MLSPVFVAIGANLPGPDGEPALVTCERAVAALRALPGMRLVAVSRWYRTAPVPVSDQPDYINGVAWLEGAMPPAALLAALHLIEAGQGRVRGARNAARTLDLDIVAMGDLQRAAPDPVLPHPRMAERAFVLRPLADIALGWRHPVSGLSVCEMLAALGAEAEGPEPL
jgi:2-amino-4-hydroxy-6-hydroxymethyldihydropteridine diphosphokinase